MNISFHCYKSLPSVKWQIPKNFQYQCLCYCAILNFRILKRVTCSNNGQCAHEYIGRNWNCLGNWKYHAMMKFTKSNTWKYLEFCFWVMFIQRKSHELWQHTKILLSRLFYYVLVQKASVRFWWISNMTHVNSEFLLSSDQISTYHVRRVAEEDMVFVMVGGWWLMASRWFSHLMLCWNFLDITYIWDMQTKSYHSTVLGLACSFVTLHYYYISISL